MRHRRAGGMSCIGRRPLNERELVSGRGGARGQLPGRDGAESRVVTSIEVLLSGEVLLSVELLLS